MEKITVLTADVIGSRKFGTGFGCPGQQHQEIEHPALLVPFSVSRGTKCRGIISGWLSTPQLVRMLRWRCRPHQLRIGIGIGYNHDELGDDPWKLSGPAFFLARRALEESPTARTQQPGWPQGMMT